MNDIDIHWRSISGQTNTDLFFVIAFQVVVMKYGEIWPVTKSTSPVRDVYCIFSNDVHILGRNTFRWKKTRWCQVELRYSCFWLLITPLPNWTLSNQHHSSCRTVSNLHRSVSNPESVTLHFTCARQPGKCQILSSGWSFADECNHSIWEC